ncbi:MAG: AMP-binding protein [Steroidobacteraceae bacterium]|nr:AMP-binding protein [Steroidobacteraceae bacterium]MBP7012705.1 AMP-binding protein [Steroidobacteraceae bacterium]
MRERNELILSDLVAARAETQPDRDVLTFEHYSLDRCATPDEVRTYAQLDTNARRIAARLRALGMNRGDRFALVMRNHPEFVEAMLAASLGGWVFVPIDPRTPAGRLAFMLRDAGCKGVFAADYCLGEVLTAQAQAPGVQWVMGLDSGEPGLASVDGARMVEPLAALLAAPVPAFDPAPVELTDPYQIIYTSGTTGDPKGIVGNHRRIGATAFVAQLFGYQPDERPYTGLSFSHNNAQTTALIPALKFGYRAVISRRFTKSLLWDVCRRYDCTSFAVLGGMATAIYSEPPRNDDADNPVRMIISSGMPAVLWRAFEQRFGVRLLEMYGASDGGGLACNPPGQGPVGSFGRPVFGVQMKILDADGNECPPGIVGEICCRPEDGSEATVEYFNNAEASRRKIVAGWNRSGDMGHRDAEGWLYYDHRKGGGIRRNGDFIDPGAVERVIAEHPQVDDAYVWGVPAASGAPGEKDLVAAIVPADRDTFDAASVFAHCRRQLEANAVPGWLQILAEIPKTASEKPQERRLRQDFSAGGPHIFAAPGTGGIAG